MFSYISFDSSEIFFLFTGNECISIAERRCAAGSSDPMHIIFRKSRRIKINDVGNAFHIDAACRDVGGDEDLILSLLETCERALALRLRAVRMQCYGFNAAAFETV